MRFAKSLVAIGEMLLMSTTILPGVSPSATPPGPNRAASTFGVSGTMVMMTSAAGEQMARHGSAHDAQADESDVAHCCFSIVRKRGMQRARPAARTDRDAA